MVTKDHILEEIRRTAGQNGGMALGRQRFHRETGIRAADWSGRYWARWGDALKEAGLEPNELRSRLHDSVLLEKLVPMIRELGRLPVEAELRLKRREDATFPSHSLFKRFGSKARLAAAVTAWSEKHPGHEDVVRICAQILETKTSDSPPLPRADEIEFGSVYLLRSGRFYKVGRSNAVGRRERELAIQLPERATVTHTIKTDDPVGIELYWHRRFEGRRKNGEWFELTAEDLAAFKRRRFM